MQSDGLTGSFLSLFSFVCVCKCLLPSVCVCEPRVCLVPTEAEVCVRASEIGSVVSTHQMLNPDYQKEQQVVSESSCVIPTSSSS